MNGAKIAAMGERVVARDAADIWLDVTGKGPAMLMIPGGPGNGDYLASVAAMVDDMSTVLRIEPRGCGRSSADGKYDLATTFADFESIRTSIGIDSWMLCGHSHGAFLALAYALAYPTCVDGLILLSSCGLQNDRSWHTAYEIGRDAGLDRDIPVGTYWTNYEVQRVGMSDYKEYVRRPGLWRDVSNLQVPVLAVNGERDIRPIWPVQQLVTLLPEAYLELIYGAPHDFWYTHPGELRLLLRRFLGERMAWWDGDHW